MATRIRVYVIQLDIGFISERTFALKSNMILRIVLMFSVTLSVLGKDETLIGCFSPQYLEIGTPGVIQCQFPTDFGGVYWFDNVTSENVEPTLSYKDSVKGGPGYSNGEFDIFPNGSLIIKKTEVQHEKTFKVICFRANDLYNLFHISVITTVSPTQVNPQISKCDDLNGICFLHEQENSLLYCTVNASRPASTVEWFVQLGEERELINSSKIVNANPDSTFSTIARLNLSSSGGSILTMLVCGAKQEHIGDWKYKPVLIEFLQNYSEVSDSVTSVYFTLNERATLQCPLDSTSHIHRVVLWKRNFLSLFEDIALWTKANPQTTESFDNEYSVEAEGSLVINSVKLHHEGHFTCIASSLTTEMVNTFHVVVIVPPLPRYITISECPGLEKCTVVSSGTGEITGTVSGVRPLLTLDWSTRDNSTIYFKNEETSTKEHAGMFSVSSTLSYKLSADIECGGFAFVTCYAQGVSASSFSSVREVELVNVKCSREPGGTSDSKNKSLSVTVIILIAVISTFVVVINCTILVRLASKQYQKSDETMEEDTHLNLLDPNKDGPKEKFITELKITYGELLVNWPSTQWAPEYEELAKYVYIPNNISMKVEQKISSRNNPSSLKSYKDLFEREDLADRHILIEGGPGQGKTFFIMDLIKKWIESDNESPLKQYDIVITFSLKDMDESKTFTQMIVNKLVAGDSHLTYEQIKDILEGESRYLVLLDEFEQYPEKDKRESTVQNIMMKRIMRNTKVILMTRSTFATKTLGKGTAFFTLDDFTNSQIYEYFQKFVGDLKEQELLGERLKAKFQENDNIALMCGTPFILFMFVCIFLKSQYAEEKLESVTTFFEKLLLPSTYSCYGGDSATGDFKASFEHPHSIGISKAASDGLKTSQFSWPKVSFSKLIDESYLEAMTKFGIVKEVDKTCIKFSHDMYQYFYGAVYLAFHLPANDLDNYLAAVDAYTCQQLLVFTCGLSKKEIVIDKVVKYLLKKKDLYPFPIRDCIIQCLKEVNCHDWNGRGELLEELCRREYALSISVDDSATMTNAKATLINICSKRSIPFNVLAFSKVIERIDGSSIVIDSGASLILPRKVNLFSLTDFNGIVSDSHVMSLIENTENLTGIFVYSSLLPSRCTKKGLDIIKERKVTTLWITFENQSVVTVSFPSICHGVWLRLSEVVIIFYLRFCKEWNTLSEEDRTNKEQDILKEIKEKGFKNFLKHSKFFSWFESDALVWWIEKAIEKVEVLINEWFWVYEASNDEAAQEHSKNFAKSFAELQNRLKGLENFMPGEGFPKEIFHQVGVKDIQYQQEGQMRPLLAILKHICQEIL